ncbi:DUF1684 domain-containing protein [Puerhibacterium puerhi]|uniref:DUF1684 domain-containing protein n=1 Tax=Puerhibacterium puerhi TaxID=2692623 RepID=UPI0013581977|nr:DUF1684 domain-containing protein [Puerhibacterium puerhi]
MTTDTPTHATSLPAAAGGHAAEAWSAWRAGRERDLAAPHGWLTLVGYHWLPAEPGTLPGVPGVWWADTEGAHVRGGDPGRHGAPTLVGEALRHGATDTLLEEGRSSVVGTYLPLGRAPEGGAVDGEAGGETAAVAVELVRRTGRYAIRLRDPLAPARLGFTGVPTFGYDEAWVRDVPLRRHAEPSDLVVGAARAGLVHRVQAIGEIDLADADGRRTATLTLTGKGGAATLLFSDEADGVAPWRALWVDLPDDVPPGASGTLRLDLNRVLNLPYAFSDHGTCPAPAPGNHVPFAVAAGEKAPR